MPDPTPQDRTAFRLLVTGSRDWTDAMRVWGSLQALADQMPGQPLIIVHGDASRGVDRIARRWVLRKQAFGSPEITEERHPAAWDGPCRLECRLGHRRPQRDGGSRCPAAGVYRNQEMVETGPDACFAWIALCTQPGCGGQKPHGSHGAADCADRAEGAGIQTARWYDEALLRALDVGQLTP